MKKILLGTTAVVALGAMSAEAYAADPINLGLGGFLRDYVNYSNHDPDAGTADNMQLGQWQNSEVYVTGSTTLDNGIDVAARVEIETNGEDNGNSTDRVFMTLGSDGMGLLRLGVAAHMMDDHAVRAPMVGPNDWGDMGNYTQEGATATNNNNANDLADFGDNSIKIGYQSPTFAGATVYASYGVAEGSGASNGRNLSRATTHDSVSFGLAYSGEFSGASVSADVGQFIQRSATNGTTGSPTLADGKKVTRVGVNVGMSGFTVGGSFSDINDDVGTANDGDVWELGVGYETGPYALAAAYMSSKAKGAATVGNDEWTAWTVGASYDLGAGVGLVAQYHAEEWTQEGNVANGSSNTSALVAGVEIGF